MNRFVKITLVTVVAGLAGAGIIRAAQTHAEKSIPDIESGVHGGILKTLAQLDLTDSQKQQIAGILKQHRAEIRSATDPLVDARKQLFETVHADSFNEQAVRDACRKVAGCQEQMAVTRARLISELKTILTPEQKNVIQEARARVLEQLPARLDNVRDMVDTWLDKHSAN